jgi:isoleucyl-tRNA synthetase
MVNEKLEYYDMTRAARIVSDFVLDDISNWYVRRNRKRFWKGELNRDKLSAYQTLYEVLFTVAKLIAPIAPFVSEEIYLNLRLKDELESVHLVDFPILTEDMRQKQDRKLEERMRIAQQVVSLARSLRNNAMIKVRKPLRELIIASPSQSVRDSATLTAEIIKDEINVKKLSIIEKTSDIVLKKAKPKYRQLGPKVGKLMKKVADIISNLKEETLLHLEESGEIKLDIEGTQIHISLDDVEIFEEIRRDKVIVVREGNILIALDTHITPELEKEGLAREFVNRVQNLRKEAGFDVTDRIMIYYNAPEKIHNAVQHLADYIMTETLATSLESSMDESKMKKDLKIDGMSLTISLEKNEN